MGDIFIVSGLGDDVQKAKDWVGQKIEEMGFVGCEYIIEGLGLNHEEALNVIHSVMRQFSIEAGMVRQVLTEIWNEGLENHVRNKIKHRFDPLITPPQHFVKFHSSFQAFHESQKHDLNTSLSFITGGAITSPTITKIAQDHAAYLPTTDNLLAGGHSAGNTYMWEAPAILVCGKRQRH